MVYMSLRAVFRISLQICRLRCGKLFVMDFALRSEKMETNGSTIVERFVCKEVGYTNLTSHVRDKHVQYFRKLQAEIGQSSNLSESKPVSIFYSKRTLQLRGWVDLVIGALLPFSVVESPAYRKHIKHEPISRKSPTRYLEKLTSRVERKIAAQLPFRFAIVFDGWSNGDTHYIACYASYPSTNNRGFGNAL